MTLKFSEIVDQASALLQRKGRMSYGALKMEFDLDDAQIDVLKEELLFSHPEIEEIEGRGVVWNGIAARTSASQSVSPASQPPVTYTPPHLAERIVVEQAAMEARGASDGERKTITALFADLKGSTALIEGLDPEDARAIIDPALQIMMDAVHRYDGYVAQALGDGIFALFGAPIALEDHPQRALYAALRMQHEMHNYSDRVRLKQGSPLAIRVGINTGEVVVRSIRKDDLHTDYVPVGHSTNLAARMEQMATPGSILVTDYTHKLTEGYFEFKTLGAAEIKGVDQPLTVHEVLGVGPLRTRLQVSARRGLSRFVGRHSELDQLRQALALAKNGHGQIVGVMGEPGLGKSRVFHEFKLISESDCLILEAFSVSHGKASPYLPIIELLKTYFEITVEDDERKRQEKVNGKVLTLDRALEDTLAYFYSLLGIEEQTASLQQMDPQIRHQRTFDAIKKLFLRESLNRPLTIIFEDLHWIDKETQGFLDTLSEGVAGACVLLLVNYRPEYHHDWGTKTYYTQLRLAPLGHKEAKELLTFLVGTHTSLQNLKQLILERTEGTPFFMEEVVQTLAEENVLLGERGNYHLEKTPSELQISPTVQGVLAARIDRLEPTEKALLQQLSVIGREFPAALVREVVAASEDELYGLLASLQRKEFLYEQPALPDVEYFFKHALTQEVAYGTVLHDRRKELHNLTALAIEALYTRSLEDYYDKLAHHFQRADNTEKAMQYLELAGYQAVRASLNEDAVRYFTAALRLLDAQKETRESRLHELDLRVALGTARTAIKGWASPQAADDYSRANEICRETGDTEHLFPVLWGLGMGAIVRANLVKGRELSELILVHAQQRQDTMRLLGAHWMVGTVSFHAGEYQRSIGHLEKAHALYDPSHHSAHVTLYGLDYGVFTLSTMSHTLWCLGYPDRALHKSHEALALAQKVQHPYSIAVANAYASMLYQFCQQKDDTRQTAEATIALCTKHGFRYYLGWGIFLQGWAWPEQDQLHDGLVQMRQGLTTMQDTGAKLRQPYYLTLLADAQARADQPQLAWKTLSTAFDQVNETRECWWEAELYRLKGELIANGVGASRISAATPEACFQQAINIAQQQQAKSLELRVAISLAGLWRRHGKQTEAHELLFEIVEWFTEGFETKDLQEAKALLDELG